MKKRPGASKRALRRRAKQLGIADSHQMRDVDLIRAIQLKENHQPCYSQFWSAPCIDNEDCEFRNDCSSNVENGPEPEEE